MTVRAGPLYGTSLSSLGCPSTQLGEMDSDWLGSVCWTPRLPWWLVRHAGPLHAASSSRAAKPLR